jgi:outer membrane protein assembly factor BamD (BamD/ComL family)
MFRASYLLLFAVVIVLSGGACEKKKTAAQLNAEKEKVWQGQQKLRAAKYYQQLIDAYPDSPHVAEARTRLAALGPIATPARAGGPAKPAASAKPGASPAAATAAASPKPKS